MGYWSKKKWGRAVPFPRGALVAGVGTLGLMTWAIVRSGRQSGSKKAVKAPAGNAELADAGVRDEFLTTSSGSGSSADSTGSGSFQSQSSGSTSFVSSIRPEGVSPANVPSYVLATSGLDNEQKLQVALCRRQAWLRATQAAPMMALWAYAGCILLDASKLVQVSKNVRMAAPISGAIVGATLGSYFGGLEGKPMMNAALESRSVEGAHTKRSQRPQDQQQDALVAFMREGTQGRDLPSTPK